MRKLNIVLAFFIFLKILSAQTHTEIDSSIAPADTVGFLLDDDITQPVEVDTNAKITLGKILLGASATIGIPLTTGFVLLSLFPPSFVIVEKNGNYHNGVAFEIALGYGDSTRFRFSKRRLIFHYSYLGKLKNRVMISLNQDVLLKRFGRARIFGAGFSIGIFGWTNFIGTNATGIEVSAWVGNAMNVRYIFLFPQHHLFIKYRRGLDLKSGNKINEVNIGFSSSITLRR